VVYSFTPDIVSNSPVRLIPPIQNPALCYVVNIRETENNRSFLGKLRDKIAALDQLNYDFVVTAGNDAPPSTVRTWGWPGMLLGGLPIVHVGASAKGGNLREESRKSYIGFYAPGENLGSLRQFDDELDPVDVSDRLGPKSENTMFL